MTHKRLVQLGEYLIGGGVYFWLGLGIFAFCYSWLGWNFWVSKILADVIGWTLNYLIQRYWAFFDRRLKKHEGRVRARYILINVLDFGLDYLIIAGFRLLGFTPYLGFFVSAAFTTVWDYLWYRYWVFKPTN